jgi:hypothetical protein
VIGSSAASSSNKLVGADLRVSADVASSLLSFHLTELCSFDLQLPGIRCELQN